VKKNKNRANSSKSSRIENDNYEMKINPLTAVYPL
jgi:hypothetical protein